MHQSVKYIAQNISGKVSYFHACSYPSVVVIHAQIARFMGPTGGPLGSCQPPGNLEEPKWWLVNIRSDNGLVSIKYWATIFTKQDQDLWCNIVSLGHNGFEVTQWNIPVNSFPSSVAYMCQWTGSALVQIMACHLFGAKPLPDPILTYCLLEPQEQTLVKIKSKCKTFIHKNAF